MSVVGIQIMNVYFRGSQQAARGPNLARRPFLVGPLSTLKYTEIHRAMVFIWPSDTYRWAVFGPLWPTIEICWEPLVYFNDTIWIRQNHNAFSPTVIKVNIEGSISIIWHTTTFPVDQDLGCYLLTRGVPIDPKISFCTLAQKSRISYCCCLLTFASLPPCIFWHVFEKIVLRCTAIALWSLWTPCWPPTGGHLTK